ncbi:MAG: hypothetical protein RIC95_05370 [Vicingaceae bacterium]
MKFILSTMLLSLTMLFQTHLATAQAFIDLESGVVFSGYNNVQVPGDAGTRFSLKTDLSPDPSPFYRARAGYTIKSRHTFSALYAPLTINSNGSTNFTLAFAGENFSANSPIEASYTFNSYRLTYRYRLVDQPKFELGLGFSGKIRDAEISLKSEGLNASKTNLGFVPLINFRLHWQPQEKMGILLRGDALAAPQGRAEDVMLAGTYNLSEQLRIRAGYRILEGGADNDEVYNFTLVHYATVGFSYTL